MVVCFTLSFQIQSMIQGFDYVALWWMELTFLNPEPPTANYFLGWLNNRGKTERGTHCDQKWLAGVAKKQKRRQSADCHWSISSRKSREMTFFHFLFSCVVWNNLPESSPCFLSLCPWISVFIPSCTLPFFFGFLPLLYSSFIVSFHGILFPPPPLFISADIFSPVTSDTQTAHRLYYSCCCVNLLFAGNKASPEPAH